MDRGWALVVGNEDKGLGFELSACWVCLGLFFWGGDPNLPI